jgi:hypothetical protein
MRRGIAAGRADDAAAIISPKLFLSPVFVPHCADFRLLSPFMLLLIALVFRHEY